MFIRGLLYDFPILRLLNAVNKTGRNMTIYFNPRLLFAARPLIEPFRASQDPAVCVCTRSS